MEPVSSALECFPAILQALTARPLQLPALTESFIMDLAAAVTTVTSDEALGDTTLSDFKARWALDIMLCSHRHTEVHGDVSTQRWHLYKSVQA